jgi:hypothetical protein
VTIVASVRVWSIRAPRGLRAGRCDVDEPGRALRDGGGCLTCRMPQERGRCCRSGCAGRTVDRRHDDSRIGKLAFGGYCNCQQGPGYGPVRQRQDSFCELSWHGWRRVRNAVAWLSVWRIARAGGSSGGWLGGAHEALLDGLDKKLRVLLVAVSEQVSSLEAR